MPLQLHTRTKERRDDLVATWRAELRRLCSDVQFRCWCTTQQARDA